MNYTKPVIFTFLVMIFFCAATSGSAQTAVPAPVGLVSWWSSDGNALDARSRNNGTLQNGATYAAGNVGQAFSFDGINDVLSAPKSSELNFGTGDFSVEYWVKFNNVASLGGMMSGDNFGQVGDYNGWLFNNDTGQIGLLVRKASVGSVTARVAQSNFSNGVWYHLAGVRSGRSVRLYVNGVLSATATETTAIDVSNSYEIRVGSLSAAGPQPFNGQIDEPAIYNRALSATEVQAIFNAGTAGKTKPTATTAPANLVGFWSGDGNANDIAGTNNGTLINGTPFAPGEAGQTFSFDGFSQYVRVPDSPSLEVSNQLTLEAWIKPDVVNDYKQIISKFGDIGSYSYQFGLAPNGALRTDLSQTGGPVYEQLTSPTNVLTAGQWQHVAVTFNGGATALYVNGAEVANATLPVTSIFGGGTADLNIGRDPVSSGGQYFDGLIDEPSIYNRALTAAEIASIYNAGSGGKLKQNPTPTGSNVAVQTGRDATVTFPTVSTAGNTEQIPIELSTLPPLPSGSTATGLAYDISTSATYSGSPRVCFNLPSISNSVTFGNLRIAHLEASVWVNRTDLASIDFATRTICTDGLTSLSPFAIVSGFAPTAASASVSGRVGTSDGRGISNAVLSITNTRTGETRSARTGSFGYYSIGDLATGETYVLTINSKRFVFGNPSRVISLSDNAVDEDFIADATERSDKGQGLKPNRE